MTPDARGQNGVGLKRFATTRWSVILSSTVPDEAERRQEALSQICRIYWRPVFSFICRRGYNVTDAQDLTQDFFMTLLHGNLLKHADPARGRFRSLLLTAVQNFLKDAQARRSAKKRGGTTKFVSWDEWMAESPSDLSLPSRALDSWTAERLFDVSWAATVVEQALRRLGDECELRGRRRVFDVLRDSLSAERTDISYAALAGTLGIAEAAVKRVIHQLRRRYRALLREEVSRTVESAGDVEDEIRYLCTALAAGAQ